MHGILANFTNVYAELTSYQEQFSELLMRADLCKKSCYSYALLCYCYAMYSAARKRVPHIFGLHKDAKSP